MSIATNHRSESRAEPISIDNLLGMLTGVERAGENSWLACCPAHNDNSPSLSVSQAGDGKILLHCHAGCEPSKIVSAIGLELRQLFPQQDHHANGKSKPRSRIVATYDYRDEAGTLLYQALRMEPKDFRQRTPDGDGWKWKLNGVRRVPYRLPELKATAAGTIVLVPEGEKDVDAARKLGFVATCNVGGAGKWKAEYADHLAGQHVVAIADNDDTGRDHARQVAKSARGTAVSVKVLELPGVPPKGDLSDWTAAGGTREELLALIEATPEWAGDESKEAGDKPASHANTDSLLDSIPGIVNSVQVADGEETITLPLSMSQVIGHIRKHCDNWPRRVQNALFIPGADGVDWLTRPAALFGYFASHTGVVKWPNGSSLVSKDEVFAELQRTAKAYAAVESLPHVPPLPDHYYTWPDTEPGDGKALAGLLERFNPETDIDADLIKAMFATVVYGGPPGSRPAFGITSDAGRGAGKTRLAGMLGLVAGGVLEFSNNEDVGQIKQRLLSADALGVRVALLDNVKSLRFSWAELEALITALVISGKRMYVGEARRPNTLTWIITLNGASLSTDMAQRMVIIKLAKPKRSGSWEEECTAYIVKHRRQIVADLIGFYGQPAVPLSQFSRWASWERAVLARLPEPNDAQKVILERQGDTDVEHEEAGIIVDNFRSRLADLHYVPDVAIVHIPSKVAAAWLNEATNENHRVTGAVQILKQLHAEGRVRCISPNPTKANGRGFLWTGPGAEIDQGVSYDIETRITEITKPRKF